MLLEVGGLWHKPQGAEALALFFYHLRALLSGAILFWGDFLSAVQRAPEEPPRAIRSPPRALKEKRGSRAPLPPH